jgi:hypothetical protein
VAGFNPDAFLAQTAPAAGGSFDPDAFLAQTAAPAPAGPGQLESLGRGALQGGSLGFSDEIAGGIEAALEKLRGTHEDIGKLYAKHRDESRAANAAAEAANPLTYGGGKLAGGLAPALLTAGESLPLQVAAGAGLGALGNLGEAKALDQEALESTAKGALGGALGAGLGGLGAKGLGAVAKPVGEALEANAGKLGGVAEKAVEKLGEGGVVGSILHGNLPGAALAAGAGRTAPLVGKAVTGLAGSLGRVGQAAAKNPALLGKYGSALAAAARAGPQALAATHFSLAQKDPGYQQKVLDLQNDHPELDNGD